MPIHYLCISGCISGSRIGGEKQWQGGKYICIIICVLL